jgi:hypothetical protein
MRHETSNTRKITPHGPVVPMYSHFGTSQVMRESKLTMAGSRPIPRSPKAPEAQDVLTLLGKSPQQSTAARDNVSHIHSLTPAQFGVEHVA